MLTPRVPRPGSLLAGLLALAALLWAVLAPSPALAAPPYSVDWELARLHQDGRDSLLAVFWLMPDQGYHAYAHDPGDTGQPTVLELVHVPDGVSAQVLYPPGAAQPDVFDPDKIANVYEGPTPIFLVLDGVETDLDLTVRLRMALCSDKTCWPVMSVLAKAWTDLDLAALPRAETAGWWPDFPAARQAGADPESDLIPPAPPVSLEALLATELPELTPRYFQPGLEVGGLGKAVLFALLAGLILNFMPCVLPVVSLKLSTIVAALGMEDRAEKEKQFREHNIWFALGVLAWFCLLSVILGMAGLAWGQLFQQPGLVLGLTVLLFALGLSLFGLFDLPVIDLKTPSGGGTRPRLQAFSTGVLATLLATPCSGPFLGGVLGWALLQPPLVISSVFFCIGLGMASPYLAMAAWPGLARRFPKPGPWTLHLERVVGFFLMGTCVYLLGILPGKLLVPALAILVVTAFAAWMWGSWTNLSHSAARRLATRGAALALVGLALFLALRPERPAVAWEAYEQGRFVEMLGSERILLDFTADWCPNCKLLEQTALAAGNRLEWKRRYGLRFVRADLTRENPDAMALLRELGSQSIPVVAVFPRGEGKLSPVVLRDLFSTAQMDKVLEELFPDSP